MRITAWPKPDQYSAVSWTTSPVTQVAEVAVNRQVSQGVNCPSRAEIGRWSRKVPSRMMAPKLTTIRRVGLKF